MLTIKNSNSNYLMGGYRSKYESLSAVAIVVTTTNQRRKLQPEDEGSNEQNDMTI
jgi:hypothetical protein